MVVAFVCGLVCSALDVAWAHGVIRNRTFLIAGAAMVEWTLALVAIVAVVNSPARIVAAVIGVGIGSVLSSRVFNTGEDSCSTEEKP